MVNFIAVIIALSTMITSYVDSVPRSYPCTMDAYLRRTQHINVWSLHEVKLDITAAALALDVVEEGTISTSKEIATWLKTIELQANIPEPATRTEKWKLVNSSRIETTSFPHNFPEGTIALKVKAVAADWMSTCQKTLVDSTLFYTPGTALPLYRDDTYSEWSSHLKALGVTKQPIQSTTAKGGVFSLSGTLIEALDKVKYDALTTSPVAFIDTTTQSLKTEAPTVEIEGLCFFEPTSLVLNSDYRHRVEVALHGLKARLQDLNTYVYHTRNLIESLPAEADDLGRESSFEISPPPELISVNKLLVQTSSVHNWQSFNAQDLETVTMLSKHIESFLDEHKVMGPSLLMSFNHRGMHTGMESLQGAKTVSPRMDEPVIFTPRTKKEGPILYGTLKYHDLSNPKQNVEEFSLYGLANQDTRRLKDKFLYSWNNTQFTTQTRVQATNCINTRRNTQICDFNAPRSADLDCGHAIFHDQDSSVCQKSAIEYPEIRDVRICSEGSNQMVITSPIPLSLYSYCAGTGGIPVLTMDAGQRTFNRSSTENCVYQWTHPGREQGHAMDILDRSVLNTENAILRQDTMDQLQQGGNAFVEFIAHHHRKWWMIALFIAAGVFTLCLGNCLFRNSKSCFCPNCTIRDIFTLTWRIVMFTLPRVPEWDWVRNRGGQPAAPPSSSSSSEEEEERRLTPHTPRYQARAPSAPASNPSFLQFERRMESHIEALRKGQQASTRAISNATQQLYGQNPPYKVEMQPMPPALTEPQRIRDTRAIQHTPQQPPIGEALLPASNHPTRVLRLDGSIFTLRPAQHKMTRQQNSAIHQQLSHAQEGVLSLADIPDAHLRDNLM